MERRRSRASWIRIAIAVGAIPFLWTVSPGDAQAKGKKKDPCDPTYVPAKGEAPPACPGVKDVPLEPAQGHAALAPTPPPVPKKKPRRSRRKAPDTRAVVNSPGFHMTRNGVTKIFVEIHGTPKVKQYATRGGVTYVLSDCRVPVHNNRYPLMTQYFNTPVADARLRQFRHDVLLQIDLRAPAAPTPRLVELVKGQVVLLEVSFPAGNYYRQIPTDPTRGGPGRGRRGSTRSYSGGTPPPGSRGHRESHAPSSSARTSVLGPPAP